MSVLLFQPAPATQAQELVAPTASEATPTAIQDTTTTTAPATTPDATSTTTDAQAPAAETTLMQATANPTATTTEPIVILHTNDMHGRMEEDISGLEAWVSTKDLAEKIQLIIKDLKSSAHADIVKVLEAFNLVYQVSFEVNGKEVTKVNEPVRIEVLLEADKEVAKVQSFDLEKKEVKEEL